MKAFTDLTTLGYMNPGNQEDYNHVRTMIQLPQRDVDKFAKDMLKVHSQQTEQEVAKDGLQVKREDIASKERMNKEKTKAAKEAAKNRPAPVAASTPNSNITDR